MSVILAAVVILVLALALVDIRRRLGQLNEARGIVPTVQNIAKVAHAGSKDLDAVPLLLTTQDQVIKTVQGVAYYGGSLDVILDDAAPS